MFAQRKTDSYDLIGTNARNSNLTVASNDNNGYGQDLINTLTFEQFDTSINQRLDSLFVSAFPSLGSR